MQSFATLAQNDNEAHKASGRMTKRRKHAKIILAAVFKITWLRSGPNTDLASYSRYMTPSGNYYYAMTARKLSVRPATRKAVEKNYCA